MSDFSLPINTTLVADVLELLRNRDAAIAKMDYTGSTNLSAGFLRFNRTNRVLEEWSGSAWVEQRVEQAGIVKPFAGTAAPRGHLLCDGSAVSRATYADLFAAIGISYGSGDGSTTFNLPNVTGRLPLGKTAAGSTANLGATGGSLGHTHSLPAQYHSMGTGADLSIGSSGGHTTTIDIAHGHTASAVSSNANILVSTGFTGYSNITLNDPGHAHTVEGHGTTTAGDGKNTGNAGNKFAKARATAVTGTGDTNGTTVSTDTNITLSNGNHRHEVSLTDSGHNHTINVGNLPSTLLQDTGGGHAHGSSTFSGSIGLVTGGVNGNAAMTSGAGDPPYIVLNYIITT
jgi:microcystin-dependent protein